MIIPEIKRTMDYSMFKYHKQNRPISDKRKFIENSIKNLNLTMYTPIIVDSAGYIIDGQHRFMACKNLGYPIFYVVMNDIIDTNKAIILLNRFQRAWKMEEFLNYQSATKGGCFKDYQDWLKHTGMTMANGNVIYPVKQINSNTFQFGVEFDKNPHADDIVAFLQSNEIKSLKK